MPAYARNLAPHVTRVMLASLAAAALLGAAAASAASPETFVFCAPGQPGSTAEARGAMDAFAGAVAARAGLPPSALAAVYHEAEEAGVARLRKPDAVAAVVPLPFFLKHERELGLRARLAPAPKGTGAAERWSLVARKGKPHARAAFDGVTVSSSAGYAPAFVRGPGAGELAPLPPSVRVVASSAVLTSLRKVSEGAPMAVLLDGAQGAALGNLPFASELEVVARSGALPAAVVATVGNRLKPAAWNKLAAALRGLDKDERGAAALDGLRLQGFVELDPAALADARKLYAEAGR